jgi:hypothetical protein
MIHLRPNRIVAGKKKFGIAMIATFLVLTLGGIGLATNKQYVSFLFTFAAESKDKTAEKVFYYSRLLVLDPGNNEVRLTRAKILIENGETTIGYEDIITVLKNGLPKEEVLGVASALEDAKFLSEAEAIRGFVRDIHGQ